MYIPRPIYPHPKGEFSSRPPASDLHVTGGITGNEALDFMAHGGTTILAPQDCLVIRLSGHDPKTGTWKVVGGVSRPDPTGDIFGWSTYLHVPDGFYYLTHQASRLVKEGQWVKKGSPIGVVGHWPHDEGRSHTHMGFTHIKGNAQSIARIMKVSAGPSRPDPLL